MKDQSEKIASMMKELMDLLCSEKNVKGFLAKNQLETSEKLPIDNWTIKNRLICYARGTSDARTFKQWQKVNRWPEKNSAFHIFKPIPLKKVVPEENEQGEIVDEEKTICIKYGLLPVHPYEKTKGEELDYIRQFEEEVNIPSLPLIDIALDLGIEMKVAPSGDSYGMYTYSVFGSEKSITMSTTDKQTFLHELSHAVDHIQNEDSFYYDSREVKEITAEFTACFLAGQLGLEANLLYTRNYIQQYEEKSKKKETIVFEALKRAEIIVNFLMVRSKELKKSITAA